MLKISWTLLLLLLAVITDLTSGRIRNRLICLGIITGFAFRIWESKGAGLFFGVLHIVFPVVLCYLLFLVHALGAGDIKLFSMIGSIWSFQVLIYCMIYSFLAGAILSLVKLLYQKNLFARISYFGRYMQVVLETRRLPVYDHQSDGKENIIHFSIAILIGFCITMGVNM